MNNQEYQFQLENFSGPLDLLLHLARTDEVNIQEVKVSLLIDQYVVYIQKAVSEGINIASSYLEMMAELIKMKSKILIQDNSQEEDEEEEEITPEELVARLIEYKKFKDISYSLYSMKEQRFGKFAKNRSNLKTYRSDKTKDLLDIKKLTTVLIDFRINQEKNKRQESIVTHNEISIDEEMLEIGAIKEKTSIYQLFQGKAKMKIVVELLAILELAKRGELVIEFSEGNIYITKEQHG